MPYIRKNSGHVMSRMEEMQAFKNTRLIKAMPSDDILHSGKPYYVVFSQPTACPKCLAQHGMAPFHPNCKCRAQPYEYSDSITVGGGAFTPFENPAFGPDPNDWMFFGRNGDEVNETPGELYTDKAFGKPIPVESKFQSQVEMHIVDRIARILFHETGDAKGQEAIAWLLLNRVLMKDAQYTTDLTYERNLYNIATSKDQFEIFHSDFNKNPDQPDSYSPLEWIKTHPYIEHKVPEPVDSLEAWENSLRVAKILVSAACNPNLDTPEKIRTALESWISNPFDCDTPYDVCEYRMEGDVKPDKKWIGTIGGNTFFIW